MTIIKLHHRHPRCPISRTSVPLLVLPLENLTVWDKDEATVALLLANLPPAQVQQLHSRAAAPGMEPMPPKTAATKAFSPGIPPEVGTTPG